MGKNNKSIKDAMVKKYGRKCFIEELGLRTKEEIEKDLARYKKSKRKELCMLTYHHIRERCRGGDATEANGAILRNINHIWFNGLSRERQREINNLFQEYKARFTSQAPIVQTRPIKLGVVELYNGSIKQAQVINLNKSQSNESEQEPEPEEIITIPVYNITPEEYEKYIKARRERERAKWKNIKSDLDCERD